MPGRAWGLLVLSDDEVCVNAMDAGQKSSQRLACGEDRVGVPKDGIAEYSFAARLGVSRRWSGRGGLGSWRGVWRGSRMSRVLAAPRS